jgi:hypothetical protein
MQHDDDDDDDREKNVLGRPTRQPTRVLHIRVRIQVIIKFSIDPTCTLTHLTGFLNDYFGNFLGYF